MTRETTPTAVDFDLHGLVGIRVQGRPSDVDVVRRQLGPIERPPDRPLEGDPAVIVRFVDRLELRGRLRVLGAREFGFTDDGFLVLRSRHAAARVRIPFDRVGQRCEIVAERRLPAVPYLVPILNLTALGAGALPLHAGAFEYDGVGYVTTGWSKGGKTETLLAFMRHGARYIGDEWVYVTPDAARMYGIPEPIRLWDWHLRQLPEHRRHVGPGDRLKLVAVPAVRAVHRRLPDGARRFAPFRVWDRAMPVLERQLHVDVPPARLFGDLPSEASGSFERLLFVVSSDRPDIVVEPVDPAEVAARMAASLAYERLDFMAAWHAFRYAFPDRSNPLVETAETRQRELLGRLFAGKPAWRVEHPYPVDLEGLYDAVRRVCR